ncbi:MAG: hypothetical protein LBC20_03040 [Planctomycetaceae bacterium]|jgi:hypothetical protein|nr:hypothetical protein [Planctomycetaceae bacterium]
MLKKVFDVIVKSGRMIMNIRLFDSLMLFSRVTIINNNNFWGNEVIDKNMKTVLEFQNEFQKQILQTQLTEEKTKENKTEF